MANCGAVQENLTAWLDEELSPRWTERVRVHVESCARCAADADGLRANMAFQTSVLRQLSTVDDVDTAALHLRLRRAVAQAAEPRPSLWSRMFRPVVLVPSFALLGVLVLFTAAGGPADVLVPLGVAAPPAAVKRAPELFKDYSIIEHLDELQHFDTVESEPLDDDDSETG